MATDKSVEEALGVVQRLWRDAAVDDFALLSRLPSTEAQGCVRYMRSISLAERQDFTQSCLYFGARLLLPSDRLSVPEAAKSTWSKHRDAMLEARGRDWQGTLGVRELKRLVSAARAGMTSISVAQAMVVAAEQISLPKAPELRRLVRQLVAVPLELEPRNDGGGEWDYYPRSGSPDLFLNVDYGGTAAQLRYSVLRRLPGEPLLRRLSYERLLAIGEGDWDLITTDNATASVTTLRQIVGELLLLAADLQPRA